jgi:hypothetical protein
VSFITVMQDIIPTTNVCGNSVVVCCTFDVKWWPEQLAIKYEDIWYTCKMLMTFCPMKSGFDNT